MRVLLTGDWHCGSGVGLTPPDWWSGDERATQEKHWNWFVKRIQQRGPFDVLVLNGDAIDGRGDRTGGVEQITVDRRKQVEMALEVVRVISPKQALLTYGTAYHTGQEEDWEAILCRAIDDELGIRAHIGAHETLSVGDKGAKDRLLIDVKHKVSGSTIPHGRHTAVAREWLWMMVWSDRGQRPRADVIVRSHVHYFAAAMANGYLAMTLPAMQGLGSRYGSRECAGTVDTGFVVFDVESRTSFGWGAELMPDTLRKARVFVAQK